MENRAKAGYFTFVLHSHLPYVRKAGRWPHGEEMLHEALAETYLPLLDALYDLKHDGLRPRLTLGLTPILLEQIADREVLDHFEAYLQEEIEVAAADAERFERAGSPARRALAEFYREHYRALFASFEQRYARNVVGAFRQLQDDGNLDVLTSAATHAYLPLLSRDSTVYAQLKVGLESTHRHLRRAAHGIWLPECGYRPARRGDGAQPGSGDRPGLEETLADLNLLYFLTDSHVIEGGQPVGKTAGDVHGPYGAAPGHPPASPEQAPRRRSTLRPYRVGASRVAVLGRDAQTGLQVWSASQGYPGDPVYREFHRKDPGSGLQYWRVTGAGVELSQKELYAPADAQARARQHASHFVELVAERLRAQRAAKGETTGEAGLLVAAYDTELFGHWWFEGVTWLREVLRQLVGHPEVGLTTADEYLRARPPLEALALPESSWGAGGGHATWRNAETEWIWPLLHGAELRMEALVARHPSAEGRLRDLLNQAARELLLLTASDWPFLISTGQAREYASGRFQQHLARFNHLALLADAGRLTGEAERFLMTAADLDNPFPNLDYRVFARVAAT